MMKVMETIAVLLPVYKNDNPKFFAEAVASLLTQTYNDFTIFLGVDGPVGGELEIVVQKCEQMSNFRVCRFAENRGLACVLNDLISESVKHGFEYLARMDADDICVSTRFEKQMSYLSLHPEVDVVGGAIEEIDENGVKNGKKVVYPLTHEECRKFFRYRDPLAHPATLFRKRFFDKAKGYRSEYRKNQDTMLWFDGFMSGCVFANVQDTVLEFRVAKEFYGRRNGWKRAKQMLHSRVEINKAMKYDVSANLFAIAMAFMTISPTWVKRLLYKMR